MLCNKEIKKTELLRERGLAAVVCCSLEFYPIELLMVVVVDAALHL
jgi:hypothetical protein